EAFGYSFEALVLYAQSLGLGTVWLGGTFDRSAFEKAIGLGENEIMPCVTPIGYPAEKRSIRDSLIRKGAGSDKREDFGNLFFSEGFDTPLSKKDAGRLYIPLEMVRWAPSAVNRQPWRVVVSSGSVHFYKKQSKGYSNSAIGDLQKVDLGIAMYHFAYGLDEAGISYDFTVSDPQIKADENIKYTATFNINS
ncbi:MAG: nitroreductase, partial [Oscillospiraceae bacterium]|nr:nitroreductase [Oscillospiraceae bacterium]